jgi:hypothetical protein
LRVEGHTRRYGLPFEVARMRNARRRLPTGV